MPPCGAMTSREELAPPLQTSKKRVRRPERVTLTLANAERIDSWNEQLSPKLNGRRLGRSDFVNWLVACHSDDLAESEVMSLYAKHFDPIKALEWAIRQAKSAQANGETIDIVSVLGTTLHSTDVKRTKRKTTQRTAKEKSEINDIKSEPLDANNIMGVVGV